MIFAADGSRLGYVQSDEIRTPVPWRDMPADMRQAVIAIEDERFYKHKGVDYSAIVRAGREEHPLGQERAGRLDDHPAAGARPLHQGPRAQLHAQDPRGQAGLRARGGALEAVDPQELPQRRAVRHRRRAHRDRRRGGRARPSSTSTRSDLDLDEAALLAGLPQAPSQYNPFRNPTAALQRRNEVLEKMAENDFITAAEADAAAARAARPQARHPLHAPPRALLLRLRAGEADRGVRRGRVPPRRAEGPHHDRPRAPGRGAQGDPGPAAATPPTPRRRDRVDRPGHRLHPRDGVQRHLQGPPLQPRRPGPPPAGLGVQDDGADDGDPEGDRPQPHHLHVQAAQPERPGLRAVEGQDLRQHLRRLDEPRARHARLGQHRVRAADHRRRAQGGARDGQDDGHRDQARRPARPRGSAACGSASRRSRWPTPTPRSRPAASATSRRAIQKVVFPDGKTDDLGKPERKRVFTDGQAYEVTKILSRTCTGGTGTARPDRLPRGGQDRHDRRLQRRLVRGLHAQAGRRRPGSAIPNALQSMPGVAGGTIPAGDLARLHDRRQGRRLQRLPAARPSRRSSRRSSASTSSTGALRQRRHATTAPAPPTGTGDNSAGGQNYRGYDPRLYESPPQQASGPGTARPPPSKAPSCPIRAAAAAPGR